MLSSRELSTTSEILTELLDNTYFFQLLIFNYENVLNTVFTYNGKIIFGGINFDEIVNF